VAAIQIPEAGLFVLATTSADSSFIMRVVGNDTHADPDFLTSAPVRHRRVLL
jgi:hypothetical protein